ncbi:uncharacterized protein BdWA1_003488 [Babesia duncani]|uniref:Uncharacterized protein n=1 Tax=Babesia duncani TaxID=323732 RepID=A0AAD9UMS2_9APIC|nr:hypothetical protein BdWA1_003488 [Babesia duncani]
MVRNTRTAKISKSAQAPKALEGSEGKPTTAAMRIINKTTLTRNMITPQNIKPDRINKPDTKAKMVGKSKATKTESDDELAGNRMATVNMIKFRKPARISKPAVIPKPS